MLSDGKITEIFCLAEDFCKFFNNTVKKHSLESKLFINDIQLITKIKSNMKNCLMSVSDKVYLRKRAVIESVNDELKNIAQIEHSRHRSVCNFMVNAVSAIAAYCFFPKKPSIAVETYSDNQLVLFY